MKSLYYISEVSDYLLLIYYLHDNKKLEIRKSNNKIVSNLITPIFAYNSGTYIFQLDLVAKNSLNLYNRYIE